MTWLQMKLQSGEGVEARSLTRVVLSLLVKPCARTEKREYDKFGLFLRFYRANSRLVS